MRRRQRRPRPTQSGSTVQSSWVTSTVSWRAAASPTFMARASPAVAGAPGSDRATEPVDEGGHLVAPLWSTTTTSSAGGSQASTERRHRSFRELVWFLAGRDVRVRYKQAALGLVWAIVQPLAGAVVLTLVFRNLADVPSGGDVVSDVRVFCGLAVWTYFAGGLAAATGSLVNNAPSSPRCTSRVSVPLSAMLPGLIDLGIASRPFGSVLVATGDPPGLAVLTLPLWTVAAIVAVIGPGLVLTTLNVRYRDVHHALGFLIQLWFFASPVAYPSALVGERWRFLYRLNPVTTVLDGFRWAMVRGPAPGLPALVSATVGAVLVWAGLAYFTSAERRFSDII